MEYFIGSITTLIAVYFISKFYKQEDAAIKPIKAIRSQSVIYELIKPVLPIIDMMTQMTIKKDTQSTKHYDNTNIKVVIVNGKAYWIVNETFYTADVVDGEVVQESTTTVDTMTMNDVQLKEISEIVDILREGK